MTNLRTELEACAEALLALDFKLEVRLDNMWVMTVFEHTLNWIEKK